MRSSATTSPSKPCCSAGGVDRRLRTQQRQPPMAHGGRIPDGGGVRAAPRPSATPIVDNCLDEDSSHTLLPREAMTNFDQLRALLATTTPTAAGTTTTTSNPVAGSAANRSSAAATDGCPCPSVQLKRRKLNELAVSTVMLLEDEISHWMRGIAELEQMLATTNGAGMDFTSNTTSSNNGAVPDGEGRKNAVPQDFSSPVVGTNVVPPLSGTATASTTNNSSAVDGSDSTTTTAGVLKR